MQKLLELASNQGYRVETFSNIDFKDTIVHFKSKVIAMCTKGLSLDLANYLLAHELGHVINPKRYRNLYFKAVTTEIYAWKTAFELLPVTQEALRFSQDCINTYVKR